MKATKQFRKMSQTNQNEVFHYQYWLVEDETLAKQLGIDTPVPGELYLLRKSSPFTAGLTPNINLNGYDFISERLCTVQEMMAERPDEVQGKVLSLAFNSPIIIKDYRQFFNIA